MKNGMRWRYWLFLTAAACAASFVIGWHLPPPNATASPTSPRTPLRLSGYQFVSPLLACGISSPPPTSPDAKAMDAAIESVISQHQQANDISKASVFFADYTKNYAFSVNGDQKYYPSSIGKLPIMMTYYAMAEHSSRDILDKQITYPADSPNLNDTQDIKPAEAIVPGQTYSVSDLLGYMIKYSDNNAAQLLFENADQTALNDIYQSLQIPIDYNPNVTNLDFITPEQVSILFRILYNATYLSNEDAENALRLLSQTTFTQGLVAGVPSSTVVSHKFGIVGIDTNGSGINNEHELHDCGIVYAPNHPYLLCVMTRGASDLPNMEQTIADISKAVYQKIEGQ
jgi:beta-lactamase class A